MHAPREHGADEQPQEAREVAELRGQHRADERAGPCDRREMVAEEHQRMGRHVVASVAQRVGGCHAQVVEGRDLGCEEGAVRAIGDERRERRDHHEIKGGHDRYLRPGD